MENWLYSLNPLEVAAVISAVLYVVLAAKENIYCWLFAFISTVIYTHLYWDVSLFMESALNVYYLVMAIYGFWQWKRPSGAEGHKAIISWPVSRVLFSVILIILISGLSGWLLASNTSAALPYLDSLTTWAAVYTTWMVTQKILENWLFWIVINSVGVYLNLTRELELTAILIGFYVLMSIYGYYNWRSKYNQQSSACLCLPNATQ